MNSLLFAAAVVAFTIGFAHSWLGERYILSRLFRRGNLPKLLGGEWFTRRTLRSAWHLTTIALCGFGFLLLSQAVPDAVVQPATLYIISLTFLASAVLSLAFVRGKHLSWVFFLAIAILAWMAAS